jgi:hypothetical protein
MVNCHTMKWISVILTRTILVMVPVFILLLCPGCDNTPEDSAAHAIKPQTESNIIIALHTSSTGTRKRAHSTRHVPLVSVGSRKPDVSKIYGRIQFVEHFPDYRVKVVTHFPDLRVQKVNHFPNRPGRWQIVNHFPDYKIRIVDHFPDFTIQWVDHFPGPRN